MLIGCCHCDGHKDPPPPPSEPIPPSESIPSSSGSGIDFSQVSNTCATPNCIGGVMARRYKFAFNWNPVSGGANSCLAKYNTEHVLDFIPASSDGNRCYFETATRAGRSLVPSPGCNDTTIPLAQFAMAQGAFYSLVGTYRYSLVIHSLRYDNNTPAIATLLYGDNLGNSSTGSVPTNKINCLSSIVLPLRMPLPAPGFGAIFYFNRYANFITADVDHADPPLSLTLTPF